MACNIAIVPQALLNPSTLRAHMMRLSSLFELTDPPAGESMWKQTLDALPPAVSLSPAQSKTPPPAQLWLSNLFPLLILGGEEQDKS